MSHPLSMSKNMTVLAMLTAFTPPASAGNTPVTIDAETRYENNIGNSDGNDVISDFIISSGISIAQTSIIDNNSEVFASGTIHYDEYINYQNLSHLLLKAETGYRIQPVAGFTQPWLEVRSSAELRQHLNSSIRDGVIFDVESTVGKYFTDRVLATLGTGADIRQAEAGRVFDMTQYRLFSTLSYQLGDGAVLSANAVRIFGDIVSTAAFPSDLASSAKAIAFDPALSSGVKRNAYRIGAQTNMIELNLIHPAGEDGFIEIGALYALSHTAQGESYQGYRLNVGYLYRF
jgi:hypothetical protein